MTLKRLWIAAVVLVPLTLGCNSSSGTEMTKDEQAHFGGTRPSPDVLAKLAKASEKAGPPKNVGKHAGP